VEPLQGILQGGEVDTGGILALALTVAGRLRMWLTWRSAFRGRRAYQAQYGMDPIAGLERLPNNKP
jgi:hypothetical protein